MFLPQNKMCVSQAMTQTNYVPTFGTFLFLEYFLC